jgi:glycosyltransferase involved in cell wall biosynthesis
VRIAIFGIKTLPALAGADRVAERLIEHLPEHEYTIYLARDEGRSLTCSEHRHYVYVPVLRGKHLRAFSFFFLSVVHFLLRGDADVAHVHNSDFGLFCWILKLKRRLAIVGTFHGRPYLRAKWGLGARLFLRLSEWAFARSCDVLTSVAPIDIAGMAIEVVANGIEDQSADRPSAFDYEGLQLSKDGYLLFACGRLDATKGLHHLLRSYRAGDDPRKLLVIGDFNHDVKYSRMIEEKAAADPRVVLFRSLVDRETLFDVIRQSALFVFPSEYEAMSMMLLEVIACRKIAVCSDIPENVAVLGADYPLFFQSADQSSLAQALTRARVPTEELERAVMASYASAAARFRWDEIGRRYNALYRRAATEKFSALPAFGGGR